MSQWSICMLFLVLSLAHPSAVESKGSGTEGERFFGRGSEVILMKTRAVSAALRAKASTCCHVERVDAFRPAAIAQPKR
jgi:hypothetical protein